MRKIITTTLAGIAIAITAAAQMPRQVQGIDYASTLKQPNVRTFDPDNFGEPDIPVPDGEFTFDMIKSWTGQGSKKAALVLQWNNDDEENAIVFGYRWDGDATGIDMLMAVIEANPRLYGLVQYTNVSSSFDPNGGYTINGIGWDLDEDGDIALIDTGHGDKVYESESGLFIHPRGYNPAVGGSSDYDYDSWVSIDDEDYWGAGWYKSYWSYWLKDGDGDTFSYSGIGASGRVLTDGCWDGWNFAVDMKRQAWKPFVAAPVSTDNPRFTDNGLHYRVLSQSLNTVAVAAPVAGEAAYTADITIPATVAHDGVDYTVITIDPEAFAGSAVTSVTLNATGRVNIGKRAFADTGALGSFTFAGSNREYIINEGAFSGSSVSSITMPDGMRFTRLGSSIFAGCVNLNEETIPAQLLNLAVIPASMFEGTGLKNLSINASTTVGARAFAGCKSLVSLSLDKQLETVGEEAFADCDALATITTNIVNPLDINANTFSEAAYTAAALEVPYSTKQSYQAHAAWGKFANISEQALSIEPGTVVTVDDINYKVCYDGDLYLAVAHKDYTGIVTIPATVAIEGEDYTVKAIDDYAFYGCTLTRAPELPNTIERIGHRAFAKLSAPESRTMMNFTITSPVLKEIGVGAFADYNYKISWTYLYVYAPDDSPIYKEIPDSVLANCHLAGTNLIRPQLRKVGNYAFKGGTSFTVDISDYEQLEEIGDGAFGGCKVTFRQSPALRRIGAKAFMDYSSGYATYADDEFVMKKNVEYADGAMSGVNGFTKLTVEKGVTDIPADMFNGTAVTEVKLPEGLKTIGNQAFRSTTSLTGTVELPSSLETLGTGAFSSSHVANVVIPEDIKITSIYAFNSCSKLTSLYIPDGVTELPANCFNFCSALKTVTGGKNITKINTNAFSSCKALESFTIPAGVTEIGEQAFYGCEALKSIDIPEGVETVRGSFRGCVGLEEIVLPSTLVNLKKTSNGWFPFYSYDKTSVVNVWYCMTPDTEFTAASAEVVAKDQDYWSKEITPFTHYYVLKGMADKMTSLCDKYNYEEVGVAVSGFALDHEVDGDAAVVTCSPAFIHSLPAAAALAAGETDGGAQGDVVPAHFAKLNSANYHSSLGYRVEFQSIDGETSVDGVSGETAVDTDEEGNPVVTATISNIPEQGLQYRVVATHPVDGDYASEWTTIPPSMTGIDAVTISASDINVNGTHLIVSGNDGRAFSVYDTLGRLLTAFTAEGDRYEAAYGFKSGVYILVSGNMNMKFVVK